MPVQSGSRQANDLPVYMGKIAGTAKIRPGYARFPPGSTAAGPGGRMNVPRDTGYEPAQERFKSLTEAIAWFNEWDDDQLKEWADHLVKIGFIDKEDRDNHLVLKNAWEEVVEEATRWASGNRKLTPHEVAELMVAAGIAGPGSPAWRERKGPFTGTKTRTDTATVLTDPTAAKALVNDVLSHALGRAANEEELRAFTATLNAAERANPVTTVTDTEYVDGEVVSTSAVQSGGLDRGQVLLDEAMAKPEYGAYQAATTYFNALMGAIQSPVPG